MKVPLKILIFFILTISLGFVLGRYTKSEVKKETKIKPIERIKVNIKNTAPIQKYIKNEKSIHCAKKEIISFQVKDQKVTLDEYDYNLQFSESYQAWWKESLPLFLQEHFDDSSNLLSEYLILIDKQRKELELAWKNAEEKTKIGDNKYLYNTSYQQDLARMNIRTKYHQKLKKLLGNIAYQELQDQISLCKTNQVKKAKNNLPHGYCPSF